MRGLELEEERKERIGREEEGRGMMEERKRDEESIGREEYKGEEGLGRKRRRGIDKERKERI